MQQDSSSECSDVPDLASQPNLIHIWTGQREGAGGWGQGEQIPAHLLYRILHRLSCHQVSSVKIAYMLLDMIWIDCCVFLVPLVMVSSLGMLMERLFATCFKMSTPE